MSASEEVATPHFAMAPPPKSGPSPLTSGPRVRVWSSCFMYRSPAFQGNKDLVSIYLGPSKCFEKASPEDDSMLICNRLISFFASMASRHIEAKMAIAN